LDDVYGFRPAIAQCISDRNLEYHIFRPMTEDIYKAAASPAIFKLGVPLGTIATSLG
jgi:hypothetical protein